MVCFLMALVALDTNPLGPLVTLLCGNQWGRVQKSQQKSDGERRNGSSFKARLWY